MVIGDMFCKIILLALSVVDKWLQFRHKHLYQKYFDTFVEKIASHSCQRLPCIGESVDLGINLLFPYLEEFFFL